MDTFYVEQKTIFETVIGSRAYGTNFENSDFDKAGVMIPGLYYNFGFKTFEQFNEYPGEDKIIYGIKKALMLIADNNPNMMDLMWVPDRCIVKITPYWKSILENRNKFISKRCRFTYSGYAFEQLERIKTHKKFLLDPPKTPPDRKSFGLPEVSIFKSAHLKSICRAALEYIADEDKNIFCNEIDKVYSDIVLPLIAKFLIPEERTIALKWLDESVLSQANSFKAIGNQYLKEEYVESAKNEVKYANALTEWKRYQHWKKNRNKVRADLEEKFGYDPKHAMHLIRLLRMGEEILRTGKVNVDRSKIDAEELKEIRLGSWSFEQVEDHAKKKDKELELLYKSSMLPLDVDQDYVEQLCIEITKRFHKEKGYAI